MVLALAEARSWQALESFRVLQYMVFINWAFKGDPTVQVQSSTVNIRQAATTNSRVITTVKRGDKLTVTDKTNSWYKIKTKSGKTGWVHASLVK